MLTVSSLAGLPPVIWSFGFKVVSAAVFATVPIKLTGTSVMVSTSSPVVRSRSTGVVVTPHGVMPKGAVTASLSGTATTLGSLALPATITALIPCS